MPYLIAVPDMLAAATSDVAGIGSSLSAATAAATIPTTAVVAAAEDEVSTAIASLFSSHAQQYQALSAQAAAFHAQFVRALNGAGGAYAAAEAANASPLAAVVQGAQSLAVFSPVAAATGRPLIGNGGLLVNTSPSTGNSATTPTTNTVPLTLDTGKTGAQYPTVNVSVNGGKSVPVLVDTGSTGLVIPIQDLGGSRLGLLGLLLTGHIHTGAYGATQYAYITTNATVSFTGGNGLVTTPTPVEVVLFAFPSDVTSLPSAILHMEPFAPVVSTATGGAQGVLGIGPNAGGPGTSTPVTAFKSPNLNQGVLINENMGNPGGYLQFGPNPLPAVNSVVGSPATINTVETPVGIVVTNSSGAPGWWGELNGVPYMDSGGANGTIPYFLDPGNPVGNALPPGTTLPAGTTISVYTAPVDTNYAPGPWPNGVPPAGDSGATNGKLLYSYTTNATDGPTVVNTSDVNSGNVPFFQGPVYISYSPSGVGTTVFDY